MSSLRLLSALLLGLSTLAAPAWAVKKHRVDLTYDVRFMPEAGYAEVAMTLKEGEMVRSFDLNLGKRGAYSEFKGSGEIKQNDDRLLWQPSKGVAKLTYRVNLTHPRDNGKFDAMLTPDWALFRGDDLIPAGNLVQADNVELVSRLQFELPKGWTSVETGWPLVGKHLFRIDNPSQLFDRPTGWIIAGKIGARRDVLNDSKVSVAAPVGQHMQRMSIMTMLTFVWPQAVEAFQRQPEKLLVVGANDPMWRGGLSAPNSLYMQAARPLVS